MNDEKNVVRSVELGTDPAIILSLKIQINRRNEPMWSFSVGKTEVDLHTNTEALIPYFDDLVKIISQMLVEYYGFDYCEGCEDLSKGVEKYQQRFRDFGGLHDTKLCLECLEEVKKDEEVLSTKLVR